MKNSSKFTSFFKLIDIFGKKTEFQIDQKPKFTTNSGGIFTLIYVGLILFLFFSFGTDMINRTGPETNISQLLVPSPAVTKVSKFDYFFIFGMQDSNSNHYIDEKIDTLLLIYGHKDESMKEAVESYIPVKPCSIGNLPENPNLQTYFQHQSNNISNLYCISDDYKGDILIQGAWDQAKFDYLKVTVNPCDKALRTCKSDDEIKSALKSSFFALYSTDHLFDLMNYNEPALKYGKDYYIETTYTLKKIINRYLKTNHLYTDDGWITTSNTMADYNSFDTDKESFEIISDGFDEVIEFIIRKSTYESVLTRKYKKIQNVFAEMTGFLQIIFIVLNIISNPFIQREYYESLTNSIYNFELDEEDIKKRKEKRKKNKKGTVGKQEKMQFFKMMTMGEKPIEFSKNETLDLEKASQTSIKKKKNADDKFIQYFFKLKESPLNLTISEIIKSIFSKKPVLETKKEQRKTGISNIFSQLDIKFILRKFAEIDKLKMLLLDEDQYRLFEYLPKPVILKNSKIHINYAKSKSMSPVRVKSEIIHHDDDIIMKAKSVQKAYGNLMKKPDMNEIDKKLLESLDEGILRLLEISVNPKEEKKFVIVDVEGNKIEVEGKEKNGKDLEIVSLDFEKNSFFEGDNKRESVNMTFEIKKKSFK